MNILLKITPIICLLLLKYVESGLFLVYSVHKTIITVFVIIPQFHYFFCQALQLLHQLHYTISDWLVNDTTVGSTCHKKDEIIKIVITFLWHDFLLGIGVPGESKIFGRTRFDCRVLSHIHLPAAYWDIEFCTYYQLGCYSSRNVSFDLTVRTFLKLCFIK